MFAARIGAILIFVHEASYNPEMNKNLKLLHKLFDRIDSIQIKLIKEDFEENILSLNYFDFKFRSFYRLSNRGFEFMI